MRRQYKKELDDFYKPIEDPWAYEVNPADVERRKRIIDAIPKTCKRIIDLGCGEGWITKEIKAKEIYGVDISETAIRRARKMKCRAKFKQCDIYNNSYGYKKPFDCILITGVLYNAPKEFKKRVDKILAKEGYIVSSHIKNTDYLKFDYQSKYTVEFPYLSEYYTKDGKTLKRKRPVELKQELILYQK